jgi:DNA-binding NarL/FixJ family response regulator
MKTRVKPCRVLIADSQFLVTQSLSLLLQEDDSYSVAGVVTDKNAVPDALAAGNVSLMIIDPTHLDFKSMSDLKDIRTRFPGLKILIITNGLLKTELYELNNCGLRDIILKTAGREEIFEAIEATLQGKKYYSDEFLDILFDSADMPSPDKDAVHLTKAEIEIVRLISEGMTTKEIAAKKNISFHTVISHRKNIFRKLGVKSISELIMHAIKAGWIDSIEYYI